jgi:NAD(P)H-dependent flavin oxidoreductase YrpB (nitropropane dioxygenase family)
MQTVFQSKFPILEACMNKGSTVELGVAVHNAGGYPSLCSWTYNGHLSAMQRDLDSLVKQINSNCVHVSFELNELINPMACRDIIKSYNIPTVEIIYGYSNHPRPYSEFSLETEEKLVQTTLRMLHEMGVKIFKRTYGPVDAETMKRHFLDGFCVKGSDAAGFTSITPTRDLFIQQRELTPNAMVIPYGGVGTAEQVKEYLDLGAEMVAVGTLLAMSEESPIKLETKIAAINSTKDDLKQRPHTFPVGNNTVDRKQNMLQFGPYKGRDDANGTLGLVKGLYDKKNQLGHAYLGHSVDQVKSILPCRTIIQNLTSLL